MPGRLSCFCLHVRNCGDFDIRFREILKLPQWRANDGVADFEGDTTGQETAIVQLEDANINFVNAATGLTASLFVAEQGEALGLDRFSVSSAVCRFDTLRQ